MDVSVIVGPGRENRQQNPPFHLSSSITFLPQLFFFLNLTSSDVSLNFKQGVFQSCCF